MANPTQEDSCTAVPAMLREDAVVHHYETQIHGDHLYRVICGEAGAARRGLEVKGTDLRRALNQRYSLIECKFLLNGESESAPREFVNGLCEVLQAYNRTCPAEWMLIEHLDPADSARAVKLIFGPAIHRAA